MWDDSICYRIPYKNFLEKLELVDTLAPSTSSWQCPWPLSTRLRPISWPRGRCQSKDLTFLPVILHRTLNWVSAADWVITKNGNGGCGTISLLLTSLTRCSRRFAAKFGGCFALFYCLQMNWVNFHNGFAMMTVPQAPSRLSLSLLLSLLLLLTTVSSILPCCWLSTCKRIWPVKTLLQTSLGWWLMDVCGI